MDQFNPCFARAELLAILHEGKMDPMTIENEKQLTQLFQQINDNLACDDDWQKRVSAMHMLQALAWGDLAQHSSIILLLRNMSDKLGSQIADLRSQVCKECCKTIAILAYRLGTLFNPIIDLLWAKLTRLVSIKVQVMAKAADSCIRVILLSCHDQRIFAHILEGCDSKAVALRRLTLEYLCIVIATWKKDLIEKNAATLKAVLLSGLRDADNNTRKLTRLLFRLCRENDLLSRSLPAVLDDQDATVQRLLQSENLNAELSALRQLSQSNNNMTADDDLLFASAIPLSLPVTASASTQGAAGAKAVSGGAERNIAMSMPSDEFKPLTETARPLSDSIKPSDRRLSVMGPKRIVAGAALDAKPMQATRILSGSVRIPTECTDGMDLPQAQGESASASVSSSVPPPVPTAMSTSAVAMRPSTRSSTLLANGPRRVLRDENMMKQEQQPPLPSSSTLIDTQSSSLGNPASALTSSLGGGGTEDTANKQSALLKKKITSTASSSSSSSSAASINVKTVSTTPDLSIDYVRNMINDPQWVNRLKAYEMIADYLSHCSDLCCSSNETTLVHCIEFALIGLQDSHQKIMIEATKLLNTLLAKEKSHASNNTSAISTGGYLPDLLAILFVKLTDSRALIRDAASSLINAIKVAISAEPLIDASIKVIAAIPESARIPAVQFYCSVIPNAREMYSGGQNVKNIREAIAKICWLTSNKENTRSGTALTLSVKKILSLLWDYNAEAVCREIMKLSFHQQTVMKSYLRAIVPDCEAIFLKYSKSLQSGESNSGKEPSLSSTVSNNNSTSSLTRVPSRDQVTIVSKTVTAPSTTTVAKVVSDPSVSVPSTSAAISLQHIIYKQQENPRFEGTIDDFFSSMSGLPVEMQKLPMLVAELQARLAQSKKEFLAEDLLSYVNQVEPGINGRLGDIVLLKGLSVNLSKAPSPAVHNCLYKILPLCFSYLEDTDMIFRQASLLTLVELYIILRAEILPHIGTLTSAQRKLLLIYAEKRGAELQSRGNQEQSMLLQSHN